VHRSDKLSPEKIPEDSEEKESYLDQELNYIMLTRVDFKQQLANLFLKQVAQKVSKRGMGKPLDKEFIEPILAMYEELGDYDKFFSDENRESPIAKSLTQETWNALKSKKDNKANDFSFKQSIYAAVVDGE